MLPLPRLRPLPFALGLAVLLAGAASPRAQTAGFADDLEDPRSVLSAFLGEQNRPSPDWDRVGATLAFGPEVDADDRRSIARRLKSVLDGRGLFVRIESAPGDGNFEDPDTGRARFAPFPGRLPDFYLERGDDSLWRISPHTIRATGALYEATFSPYARALLDVLPPAFERSFLGFTLWHLIGVLVLLALAWITQIALRRIMAWGLTLSARRRGVEWAVGAMEAVAVPLSWLASVWIFHHFLSDLRLPVRVNEALGVLLDVALAGLAVWLAFHVVDAISGWLSAAARRTETRLDDHFVPLLRTTLRVGSVLAAILIVAHSYGYPVTTLVAGLGLGGLAVALAAQDTLANVIGSVSILADRPFQVGDWVVVDGKEGTVERVGLRSTRVRTFYDSIISIPNSKVGNAIVDNMGQRKYRRIKHMLGLRYDTDPDRIHAFVEGIRAIIEANPSMRKDVYEIHLNRFSESSVDVLIYCFLMVANWHEELVARHNFFLEILRLAKELEVDFAFPTRTLHVAGTPETPFETDPGAEKSELTGAVDAFGPGGRLSQPVGPTWAADQRGGRGEDG